MTYRDWHVGMKVVALRNGCWSWPKAIRDFIVAGEVYTIAAMDPAPEGDDVPFYIVPEGSPIDEDGDVATYACYGFRPVQPRATDISIFTSMLTGVKEREPA